jgi:hypothetical protein
MFKLLSLFLLVAAVSAFTSGFAAKGARSMTMMADKSRSLPFLPQPPAIVGMTGDVGKCVIGNFRAGCAVVCVRRNAV